MILVARYTNLCDETKLRETVGTNRGFVNKVSKQKGENKD